MLWSADFEGSATWSEYGSRLKWTNQLNRTCHLLKVFSDSKFVPKSFNSPSTENSWKTPQLGCWDLMRRMVRSRAPSLDVRAVQVGGPTTHRVALKRLSNRQLSAQQNFHQVQSFSFKRISMTFDPSWLFHFLDKTHSRTVNEEKHWPLIELQQVRSYQPVRPRNDVGRRLSAHMLSSQFPFSVLPAANSGAGEKKNYIPLRQANIVVARRVTSLTWSPHFSLQFPYQKIALGGRWTNRKADSIRTDSAQKSAAKKLGSAICCHLAEFADERNWDWHGGVSAESTQFRTLWKDYWNTGDICWSESAQRFSIKMSPIAVQIRQVTWKSMIHPHDNSGAS